MAKGGVLSINGVSKFQDLIKATFQHDQGVHVGRGLNTWSNIHISDLTNLIVRLVKEVSGSSSPMLWNENGIYFVESGKMSLGDISKRIAFFAHSEGLIRSPKAVAISSEPADGLTPHGSVIWETNVQYQAIRARELLGWLPQEPSLEEEIPRATIAERAFLGSRPLAKLA